MKDKKLKRIFSLALTLSMTFTSVMNLPISANSEFEEINYDFSANSVGDTNPGGIYGTVAEFEGNKVLKLTEGQTSYITTGITADDTEKYELKFSVYPEGDSAGKLADKYLFGFDGVIPYSSTYTYYRLGYYASTANFSNGLFGWKNDASETAESFSSNRLGKNAAILMNTWYDYTAIFDHTANTVEVTIEADGVRFDDVGAEDKYSYTITMPETAYFNSLKLAVVNGNGVADDAVCYVDNISIKKYKESDANDGDEEQGGMVEPPIGGDENEPVEPPVIDETKPVFDDITIDFSENAEGDTNPNDIKGTVVDKDGNNVLKLTEGETTFYHTGITPEDEARYELKFSVYPGSPDDSAKIYDKYLFGFDGVIPYSSTYTHYRLGYYTSTANFSNGLFGWKNNVPDTKDTYDANRLGKNAAILPNIWYDYTAIFDHASNTVEVTIEADGVKFDDVGAENKYSYTITMPETAYFKSLKFAITDGNSNINDAICYVDDISIKKLINHTPTISAEQITMTDVWGNTVADIEAITPGIDKITLDFATELLADSVDGKIAFEDEKGNSVDFDADMERVSGKYIMDINGVLKPETTYTITVPSTVESVWNNKLGAEYKYTFTTLKGVLGATVNGMYSGDTKIDDISGMAKDTVVSVKSDYVNTMTDNSSVTVIVAYYKGDMLAEIDIAESETVVSGSTGAYEPEVTLPDMTGIDSVKVYVWDNTKGMIPVSDAETVGEAAEAVSGATQMLVYNYLTNKVIISGKTSGSRVALQILEKGKRISELAGNQSDEDAILYSNQLNESDLINGQYAFSVQYADLADEAFENGVYYAYLMTDGGEDIKEFTLDLYSENQYETTLSTLKGYADAEDKENFKKTLKDNGIMLGYNAELYSENAAEKYMLYVKKNGYGSVDYDDIAVDINRFLLMQAIADGNASDIESYIDSVLSNVGTLYKNYKKYTSNDIGEPSQTKSMFLTKKFKKELPKDYTYDSFESTLKKAIILTATAYADGFGDVKNILVEYGDEIGITGTVANSVYRDMSGVDYDDADKFVSMYNKLKSAGGGSSAGGSGGGYSGGRGSSGEENYQIGATPMGNAESIGIYFNDIDHVEWASEAILALADKGIVNGMGDGNFMPDDNITREEFAKILVCAMGYDADLCKENVFSDVGASDWFCPYVNTAYIEGIVKGIGDGMFGTGELISRQDMVVMICNALSIRGVSLQTGEAPFEDKEQIADYAKTSVAALYNMGVVNGVSETQFDPTGSANRAQAAKIIYGVLDYLQ